MKQEKLQKIKKIALDIDHNKAFGGKSKGNRHLERVVKTARFLAQKLNADEDMVLVAAYLHDAALPTKNDDDYQANKTLIRKILKQSGIVFDDSFISRAAEAAASHEGIEPPKTLEAKIVHDADVIEKIGLLGIIRHTWKLTNYGKINPENLSDNDILSVIDHIKWRINILETKPAKVIAEKNNCKISMKTLRKIMPIISLSASRGVITEKIAKRIKPFLSEKQFASLRSQIDLKYLKTLKI